MTDLIRNTFTGSVDQQITDKLITNILDSPEFPFSFVLNRMCPVLDGTGVVVGLLAASVLTANSGAFFLAFPAFLSGQKCLLFLFCLCRITPGVIEWSSRSSLPVFFLASPPFSHRPRRNQTGRHTLENSYKQCLKNRAEKKRGGGGGGINVLKG